jgi:hypothetical protein
MSDAIPENLYARVSQVEKDPAYEALQNIKKGELVREVEKLRGDILDAVEFYARDIPQWEMLRSRLLTILGKRGFEQVARQILERPLLSRGGKR